MQECAKGTPPRRKVRWLAFMLPFALMGCVQQPVQQQPRSASPACEQEARRLGFVVLEVGSPTPQPDGGDAVPIFVKWGSGGGVHLRCRYDPTYGTTLG